MIALITRYIEDQKLAWSPTTLRSEFYRLCGVQDVLDGNPLALWNHLVSRQKPYARLTTWTRVTSLWDWLVREGHRTGSNPYRLFREKNARLFKHVYQTKTPIISFEEAVKRIKTLPRRYRELGLQMLGTGERFSESQQTPDERGRITGKGNKSRRTYRPTFTGTTGNVSYACFRRALQTVSLVPHDLRKLHASRLVDVGASEYALLQAMGWSNIETAKRYIKPTKDKNLELLIKTKIHSIL